MGNYSRSAKRKNTKDRMSDIYWWIYRYRGVLLAIPVAALSVVMAIYNFFRLPALVGFGLQPSGEYALLIGKGVAIMGPLAISSLCLLLMFCSRKAIYPWLISVFSLVLPLIILLTNTFPG